MWLDRVERPPEEMGVVEDEVCVVVVLALPVLPVLLWLCATVAGHDDQWGV